VSIFRGTNVHIVAVKVLAASGLSERDLRHPGARGVRCRESGDRATHCERLRACRSLVVSGPETRRVWANSGGPANIYREDFVGQALAYRNSPLLDPLLIRHCRRGADEARAFGLVRRKVDMDGRSDTRFFFRGGAARSWTDAWAAYGPNGKSLNPA
jgi:hypothetical protein